MISGHCFQRKRSKNWPKHLHKNIHNSMKNMGSTTILTYRYLVGVNPRNTYSKWDITQ